MASAAQAPNLPSVAEIYVKTQVLRSWALGLHFSFLSCPLCTYTIT